VDRFLAPSAFVREAHMRAGLPKDRIEVAPHFTPLVEDMPAFTDDGFVLFYGRLVEEKGVEILLRAMRGLPDVPCKIIGTGPEEIELHLQGDRIPNVRFEGYQSGQALWDFVRRARVVIVPSLWDEVFGMVAIEAMALGKPVIASAVGALPELICDRQSGFLIPPGSVMELAEAIQRLMRDPLLAVRLGHCGRLLAEKKYSPEGHYDSILRVYEEVCGKKLILRRGL
jgi:glycosyltransferase involved in cell wall biosynthesis